VEHKDQPTYLKTHRISGEHLAFLLHEEEEALLKNALSSNTGRTAKTLVKDGRLRLTLVAMRGGAEMREHTVEGPASFQCLRGAVQFQLGDETLELSANSLLVLDTGVSHNVTAQRDSTFLITISFEKEVDVTHSG
jgi:quercetin dioxygenase-like cupin family protein